MRQINVYYRSFQIVSSNIWKLTKLDSILVFTELKYFNSIRINLDFYNVKIIFLSNDFKLTYFFLIYPHNLRLVPTQYLSLATRKYFECQYKKHLKL